MPPDSPVRAFVFVQHLLGVGHLQRAFQLANALHQRDFDVELISGGRPHALTQNAPFPVHQLPSLRSADGSFQRLLDERDQPIDEAWRDKRRRQLLRHFERLRPNLLITETFPFGRRMLRHELMPLLEAAKSSPDCRLILASIRDILQPRSNPERIRETLQILKTFYDFVIVHGDERVARLEDSFAGAHELGDRAFYSGYLCASPSNPDNTETGLNEILVSAGGSATGLDILRTAIAAKPLSRFADHRWRLLVSPAINASDFAELQNHANADLIVERNRPDFSALIKRARLSISQAGYNTMTDIFDSETASVVIPYAEAEEVEQSLRAAALQRLGRVVSLAQADLTPQRLAAAMEAACENYQALQLNLDGASHSADQITAWWGATGSHA